MHSFVNSTTKYQSLEYKFDGFWIVIVVKCNFYLYSIDTCRQGNAVQNNFEKQKKKKNENERVNKLLIEFAACLPFLTIEVH